MASEQEMKRDATDAAFSDCVREAFDWRCARCSLDFPERKGRDVHCSHFYSRSYNSTRWFPDNATCLCAGCHDVVGKQPDEHVKLMVKVLGVRLFEDLQQRKSRIFRYRPADKKAMRKHYQSELVRLRAERRNGVTGFVNLVAYD